MGPKFLMSHSKLGEMYSSDGFPSGNLFLVKQWVRGWTQKWTKSGPSPWDAKISGLVLVRIANAHVSSRKVGRFLNPKSGEMRIPQPIHKIKENNSGQSKKITPNHRPRGLSTHIIQLDAHGHRCAPVRIHVCSRVSGALTPEQLVLDRDWWCAQPLCGLANSELACNPRPSSGQCHPLARSGGGRGSVPE